MRDQTEHRRRPPVHFYHLRVRPTPLVPVPNYQTDLLEHKYKMAMHMLPTS